MKNASKNKIMIAGLLVLALCMSVPTINAQQTEYNNNDNHQVVIHEPLAPALLEQVLAPIALYPDTLLSQILVASTYPLEVVQAARWREDNYRLTESQALAAVEYKNWDPSVKALVPFTDLIVKLSSDLEWLQLIGDAFLQNENQVLASIQDLRHKAYYEGSLSNNYYQNVVIDNGHIIIESSNQEIVYVPYYDTRIVYGHWKWKHYQPVYWRHPSHYRLHAGFYWSSKFYIKPTIFFGGFLWGARRLVVNHHFYDHPYSRNKKFRKIGLSKYRSWKHNPIHRRGVQYSRISSNKTFRNNRFNSRSNAVRQVRTNRVNNNRRFDNRTISNRNNQRRVQQQNNSRNDQRRAQQLSNNRNNLRRVQQQSNNRNDQRRAQQLSNNRNNQRGVQQQQSNRSQQVSSRNNNKGKLVVKQQSSNPKINKQSKSSVKTQSKTTNNRVSSSNKKSNNTKSNKSQRSYKSNNNFSNRKVSSSKSRYKTSSRNQRR